MKQTLIRGDPINTEVHQWNHGVRITNTPNLPTALGDCGKHTRYQPDSHLVVVVILVLFVLLALHVVSLFVLFHGLFGLLFLFLLVTLFLLARLFAIRLTFQIVATVQDSTRLATAIIGVNNKGPMIKVLGIQARLDTVKKHGIALVCRAFVTHQEPGIHRQGLVVKVTQLRRRRLATKSLMHVDAASVGGGTIGTTLLKGFQPRLQSRRVAKHTHFAVVQTIDIGCHKGVTGDAIVRQGFRFDVIRLVRSDGFQNTTGHTTPRLIVQDKGASQQGGRSTNVHHTIVRGVSVLVARIPLHNPRIRVANVVVAALRLRRLA